MKGRTTVKYVGGIMDGREKSVMTSTLDSAQEYKSSYISLKDDVEVTTQIPSSSWDYDLPYNWLRCTYDQYKKVNSDTGVIMQFEKSIERNRCEAITSKKVRCSLPAKKNSSFCNKHPVKKKNF